MSEAEFGRILLPLARRWRSVADRAMADLGLSHANGWVLLHVGRLGPAVRQNELADALDMRGSSLVRLIDQLEGEKLVKRRIDESDRRVNHILLTAAGTLMVDRIEDALRGIRRTMFEDVGDEDLAAADRVLQILSQRMSRQRRRP